MGVEVYGRAGFQSPGILVPTREPQAPEKPQGQCGEEEAWKSKPPELLMNVRPTPGCVDLILTPQALRPRPGPGQPQEAHTGQIQWHG